MMPAHATVMMLDCSISPQVTMTGGTGPRRVEPFQCILAIRIRSFQITHYELRIRKRRPVRKRRILGNYC